jgi:hypothetical protein
MPRLSPAAGGAEEPTARSGEIEPGSLAGAVAAAASTANATRRPSTPQFAIPVAIQSEIETPPPAFPTLSEAPSPVPAAVPDTGTAAPRPGKPVPWVVIAAISVAVVAGVAILVGVM